VWGITEENGIWTAATIVWAYTVSGGLFSVAYTDVVQGAIGWSGAIVTAFYLITNEDPNAPPPSIGFQGYIYPDVWGDGGACDMYQGVGCSQDDTMCCYNPDKWCELDGGNYANCVADNGAYPLGESYNVGNYSNQSFSIHDDSPIDNAFLSFLPLLL
jgi:hypothetical protein